MLTVVVADYCSIRYAHVADLPAPRNEMGRMDSGPNVMGESTENRCSASNNCSPPALYSAPIITAGIMPLPAIIRSICDVVVDGRVPYSARTGEGGVRRKAMTLKRKA